MGLIRVLIHPQKVTRVLQGWNQRADSAIAAPVVIAVAVFADDEEEI